MWHSPMILGSNFERGCTLTRRLPILERQGVGRVRHLDIGALWLQEHQLRRVVELTKVLGTEHPADLMTKHLGRKLVKWYTAFLNYEFRQGRSDTTAKLHNVQAM